MTVMAGGLSVTLEAGGRCRFECLKVGTKLPFEVVKLDLFADRHMH
jgi:hypothetical protein